MRQRPIQEKTDPVAVIGLLPRFYLGAIFAIAAYTKIFSVHGYVDAVHTFLVSSKTAGAPAFYAGFISSAVLPNISSWATAVVAGEIAVALSLLLGLFTRFGAVIAVYLLANFMLAGGTAIWEPTSHELPDMILAFIVIMTGPGRILGIDNALSR
jgi:uncharacterized membrane protein YphA (DoxX/SURF4 family)